MAKYSSAPTVVNRPAAELSEKFADFRTFQTALDNLDAEHKAKVGDVAFTEDSIKITTPQVGDIVLKVTERTPSTIKLQAQHSPVPMTLQVDLKPLGPDTTEVTGSLEVEIPMMLKPLVGPALQKAADQFGSLFGRLA